jgi:transposase
MTPDTSSLPDALSTCHEMIVDLAASLTQRDRKIDRLEHQLQQLLRARYGRSAEKIDPNQLLLFAQEMMKDRDESADKPDAPVQTVKEHTRRNGRKPLPEDLPRQRIEHELPPEERSCPCCGKERAVIGEETSEQLEYVPSSMFVIEHARKKYACPVCEGQVAMADKPAQPIEKGLAGPGLLAQVATAKYADHLPLHRQEAIFVRHGVEISRKTMCDWMRDCATLLEPLVQRMKMLILQSRAIHTDDTPVPVLDKKRDRTKKGRLWVYVGDRDHPYTIFDYTPTRSRDGPQEFLDGYSGFLQADAYAGYDVIYAGGRVHEVACWAHARRKFFECQKSDPKRGVTACAHITQLYDIERRVENASDDERLAMRQEKSVPLLRRFQEWLDRERQKVLPKSPLGEAMTYARLNWEALMRYTEQGYLAIDNNAAERALRVVAVGRKNWMFAGSDRGGETAATLYSIVASAKRHKLNIWAYLRDLLARIPTHRASQIDELLPDRWAPTQ